MMNQQEQLRWNIFIAMLAATSIATKKVITPAVNILTDLLFIPGGSTVTGVSLSFLLVGVALVPHRHTGTKMAIIQSFLALFLGSSGFQGIFVLVSYTIPGVVIDLLASAPVRGKLGNEATLVVAGICAVVAGALTTNAAFFHLKTLPFCLFLGMGALSGGLGGLLAHYLVHRLLPVIKMSEFVARNQILYKTGKG